MTLPPSPRRRDPLATLGPAARALLAPDYPELAPGRTARTAAPAAPAPPAKSPHDEARDRWEGLLRDHWRLLRGDGPGASQMPAPLTGEPLRQTVATVISPQTRQLLDDLLGEYIDGRVRRLLAAELPEALAVLLARRDQR